MFAGKGDRVAVGVGATGSGKSTTMASLLKEFLTREGGYAFTIETRLKCRWTVFINVRAEISGCASRTSAPGGMWEEGLKSALRSAPRYICWEKSGPGSCLSGIAGGDVGAPDFLDHSCQQRARCRKCVGQVCRFGRHQRRRWHMNWLPAVCSGVFIKCWWGCRKKLRVSSLFTNQTFLQADPGAKYYQKR